MEIDDQVEPLVRETLDAAVHEDEDRLDAALKAFPDEESRIKGVELSMSIIVATLHDSHDGRPSRVQLGQAAVSLGEMSEWAGVTAEDAFTYLTTLLDRRSPGELFDPDTAVLLTFVIAAGLLASSSKIREGEWWFNYVDRIEADIEAATP